MNTLVATLRGGVLIASILMAAGVLSGVPRLAMAGLVVLVLTPLARVVLLTKIFARERDWPFAAISFGVLLLLIVSMILAT